MAHLMRQQKFLRNMDPLVIFHKFKLQMPQSFLKILFYLIALESS